MPARGGQLVLLGVRLCLAGIGVCGGAGMRKEGKLTCERRRAVIE
jgi:L-rhamnose-H+ transport protein